VDAGGVRAERAAVQRAGGTYLDVIPWICTRSTCAVVVGNLLVYRDDDPPQYVLPGMGSHHFSPSNSTR
jgi:hypothetical protein